MYATFTLLVLPSQLRSGDLMEWAAVLRNDLTCQLCDGFAKRQNILFKAPGVNSIESAPAHLFRGLGRSKHAPQRLSQRVHIADGKHASFHAVCYKVRLTPYVVR